MESNPLPTPAAHESFAVYQREAHKTAGSMPPRDRVFMASMGLAGEAGEVVDELKKVHFHAKPYDREKLVRELGDVLWYLAELATAHELSLQDIAHANLEKLRKRHGGETFKPHAEQDRSPEACAREFDNAKAPLPALPVHGSCILDSVDASGAERKRCSRAQARTEIGALLSLLQWAAREKATTAVQVCEEAQRRITAAASAPVSPSVRTIGGPRGDGLDFGLKYDLPPASDVQP